MNYPRWKFALDLVVLLAAGVLYATAYYWSLLPE